MTLAVAPVMDPLDRLIIATYATHTHGDIATIGHRSVALINVRVRRLREAGLLPPRAQRRVSAVNREAVPYDVAILRIAALEAENEALRRDVETVRRDCRAAVDQACHAIRKIDELQLRIAKAAGRARGEDPMVTALREESLRARTGS